MALFQPFPPEVLVRLRALRRETRIVPAGGTIVATDQAPRDLFTVYQGWAYTFHITADGQRQIIDYHLPGDLIGTELLGAAPLGMGASALTSVALCVFDAGTMMRAARDIPVLGAALAWMTSREGAMLAEHLTSLGRRDAMVRVAHLMLHLASRQGWREEGGAADCAWPLSNVHIADTLGLTPEHVSRTLQKLRRMNQVDLGHGRLRMPTPGNLIALCGWSPGYLEPRPLL